MGGTQSEEVKPIYHVHNHNVKVSFQGCNPSQETRQFKNGIKSCAVLYGSPAVNKSQETRPEQLPLVLNDLSEPTDLENQQQQNYQMGGSKQLDAEPASLNGGRRKKKIDSESSVSMHQSIMNSDSLSDVPTSDAHGTENTEEYYSSDVIPKRISSDDVTNKKKKKKSDDSDEDDDIENDDEGDDIMDEDDEDEDDDASEEAERVRRINMASDLTVSAPIETSSDVYKYKGHILKDSSSVKYIKRGGTTKKRKSDKQSSNMNSDASSEIQLPKYLLEK
jgi:hypothetical protein